MRGGTWFVEMGRLKKFGTLLFLRRAREFGASGLLRRAMVVEEEVDEHLAADKRAAGGRRLVLTAAGVRVRAVPASCCRRSIVGATRDTRWWQGLAKVKGDEQRPIGRAD